jgi:hypothetical protein
MKTPIDQFVDWIIELDDDTDEAFRRCKYTTLNMIISKAKAAKKEQEKVNA